MTRFHVTPHAAERFVERVRPALSQEAGATELYRLLTSFGEQVEWTPEEGSRATECWEVAPGIWVPCLIDPRGRTLALTVLTNSTMEEGYRTRRNARRARRVAKRKQSATTRFERESFGRGKDWAA